jgi:predicted MFS family arabinose efflux permease
MINNVGVSPATLPVVFLVSGICMLAVTPLTGKLSDRIDKSKVFVGAILFMIATVIVYGNLSAVPFIWATVIVALVFSSTAAEKVPMSALNTAVPRPEDKGAYLSLCSSLQQVTNGLGAMIAGLIVIQRTPDAPLENFDIVCYIVVLFSIAAMLLVKPVNKIVNKNQEK